MIYVYDGTIVAIVLVYNSENAAFLHFFDCRVLSERRVMEKVKQFFDCYADDFDALYGTHPSLFQTIINSLFRASMRARYEKTLLNCQPVREKTVLDIGCGPGHYSLALAKQGARKVVGIDFAESMIQRAKEKASALNLSDNCQFFVEDIFHYSSLEPFDFSIVMGVMDYIGDPEPFIEKIIHLTKGKVFFSFPIAGGILALQRKIRYRKRCPLYLYRKKQLIDLLNRFPSRAYTIEKLHRDYYVTLTMK